MLGLNPEIYPPAKINIILHLISTNIIIQLIISAIFFWVLKTKSKLLIPVNIVLICIDLFIFATGNIFTVPTDLLNFTPPDINIGLSRYLSVSDSLAYLGPHVYWNHLRVRQPFAPDLSNQELSNFAVLNHQISLLPGNINLINNWFNVSGYNAVVLGTYASYWQSDLVNSIQISDLSDPRLSQLGVNFIIADGSDGYSSQLSQYQLISNKPSIYQRSRPTPRAWFKSDEGNVTITHYQPTSITLTTFSSSADQLILADSIYPGWQATIDNQPTTISAYKQAFRLIDIPAGKHQIKFSYQPQSVTIGATISLTSAVIALLLIICQNHKLLLLFLTGTASKTRSNV